MSGSPKLLVFDSGLGGLTVFAEVARLRPDAEIVYAADDAGFPYGNLNEAGVVARVEAVIGRLIAQFAPDVVVIACNTASTLVLPHLRAAFPKTPFIGTVPAVKPAAEQSRSHLISVLATPGTVARDYTRELVRTYAAHCEVTLVGSRVLASLAEDFMRGETPSDAAILQEIAPCFVTGEGLRTDCVVLACTHYPLLLAQFERLAPWPVAWIDPALAIARRTDHVLRNDLGFGGDAGGCGAPLYQALFTSGRAPQPALERALAERGFARLILEPMPLAETPAFTPSAALARHA